MITAQEARELEKTEKEAQKERITKRWEQAKQESYDFCNTTLNDAIQEAIRGGNTGLSWKFSAIVWDDDLHYELRRAGVVEEKGYRYSNGEPSLIADTKAALVYMPTVTEYLKAHGFKVSRSEWLYKEYGLGNHKGTKLWISW